MISLLLNKKRTLSTWHCSDEAAMRQAIDLAAPTVFTDIRHIHSTCIKFQTQWGSTDTANDRRAHRESEQVKCLRAELRNAVTEADRLRFQTELYHGNRHIACALRRIKNIARFSMGASIKKDSKLNPITSMKPHVGNRSLESAQVLTSVDHEDWAIWLQAEYTNKWRCSEDVRIRAYKHFLVQH